MEFDAFDAGIELGGLRSQKEINLLVCYLIANINQPINRENIVETVVSGGIANYFEASSSISDLIKYKNIFEDENGNLTLNEISKNSISEIENELPFTIREKATEICQKLIIREIYKKENEVKIIPHGTGFYVDCSIMSEKNEDMLSFRLFVTSSLQAEIVREKFFDNPTKIYENIIDSLFSDETN